MSTARRDAPPTAVLREGAGGRHRDPRSDHAVMTPRSDALACGSPRHGLARCWPAALVLAMARAARRRPPARPTRWSRRSTAPRSPKAISRIAARGIRPAAAADPAGAAARRRCVDLLVEHHARGAKAADKEGLDKDPCVKRSWHSCASGGLLQRASARRRWSTTRQRRRGQEAYRRAGRQVRAGGRGARPPHPRRRARTRPRRSSPSSTRAANFAEIAKEKSQDPGSATTAATSASSARARWCRSSRTRPSRWTSASIPSPVKTAVRLARHQARGEAEAAAADASSEVSSEQIRAAADRRQTVEAEARASSRPRSTIVIVPDARPGDRRRPRRPRRRLRPRTPTAAGGAGRQARRNRSRADPGGRRMTRRLAARAGGLPTCRRSRA